MWIDFRASFVQFYRARRQNLSVKPRRMGIPNPAIQFDQFTTKQILRSLPSNAAEVLLACSV
jgi:hypothetical protein